jgi:hypothetical protein
MNVVLWDVSRVTLLITEVAEESSVCTMSVLTRLKRRNIQEDGILHSHCRENVKSYKFVDISYSEHFTVRNSIAIREAELQNRVYFRESIKL